MKRLFLILLLGMALAVTACTETETYPASGAPCGADDTVKEMGPLDCVPPAGV